MCLNWQSLPTAQMSYLTFLGASSLSKFRRAGLIRKLQVNDVRAQWIHFVALHDDGKAQEYDQKDLEEMLRYGEEYIESNENEDDITTWFVQPRRGTISPWSSKATSIAEACGLGYRVKRIERGIIIKIRSEGDFDEQKAKKELYDEMTQDLSTTMPDLEVMFGEQYVCSAHTGLDLFSIAQR